MQVKASQASSIMAKAIKAKLVPLLSGSPGIGKSAIIHNIAKIYGMFVIDLRLAQCDPTDLNGFPTIIGERSGYRPMETFPIDGDKLPEGYNGWLLFLDEFTSCAPAVQAAAYKLVLDRMVGKFHLHKNVAIICAGNLETDGAVVHSMSTALQSRLLHLELVSNAPEWLEWAYENNFDHRITSYIKFKEEALYLFTADHTDNTYACNRTWEFANRVMAVTDDNDPDRLPMLAGVISEGMAREFLGFCKIYKDLPSIPEIVANPTQIKVPDEPSILFAITGAISNAASKDNLEKLLLYVSRLPAEFQVITLKETVRRNSKMLEHVAMQKWIAESATTLV